MPLQSAASRSDWVKSFVPADRAGGAAALLSTAKIGQRKVVASEVLTEMLRKLAQYLEFADRADAQALATTRFDLRRENSRQPGTDQLPAPDGLKLLRGINGKGRGRWTDPVSIFVL